MTTPAEFLPDWARREIIDHCLADLPNEGCGLLAVDGDHVMAVYPTTNEDASPVSYTIPPREHFDAMTDAESRGWEIGGVFHSHPKGPAQMSSVDRERALEPDWLYVVVGLGSGEPDLTLTRLNQVPIVTSDDPVSG